MILPLQLFQWRGNLPGWIFSNWRPWKVTPRNQRKNHRCKGKECCDSAGTFQNAKWLSCWSECIDLLLSNCEHWFLLFAGCSWNQGTNWRLHPTRPPKWDHYTRGARGAGACSLSPTIVQHHHDLLRDSVGVQRRQTPQAQALWLQTNAQWLLMRGPLAAASRLPVESRQLERTTTHRRRPPTTQLLPIRQPPPGRQKSVKRAWRVTGRVTQRRSSQQTCLPVSVIDSIMMRGPVPESLASKPAAGRPGGRTIESGTQSTYFTRVSMYTVCTLSKCRKVGTRISKKVCTTGLVHQQTGLLCHIILIFL